MKKTELIVGSSKLAYYDSESDKNAIVFVHGNSLSSETFLNQLNDEKLLTNFRLIALDLPGFGDSGHSKNPEKDYSLGGLAAVLVDYANALNLKNAVYVGHSLGGHVILEALDALPECAGLAIFGTPPVGAASQPIYHLPNPTLMKLFQAELSDADISELSKALFGKFYKISPELSTMLSEIIKKSDTKTRTVLMQTTGAGLFKDEMQIVENMTLPLAILHGKEEQLIDSAYFATLNIPCLWRTGVQYIENSGHTPQIENPDEFNRLITEFSMFCTV